VRPDAAAYRVTGGALEIDTSKGDIYQGTATNPKNLLLQPAPDGDWTIETKVDGSAFNEAYQQGGLMVYGDDANYVKFDFLTSNASGGTVTRGIELRSEANNVVLDPQPNASPAPTQGVWYLRLAKAGTKYTGSYSSDGLEWTALPPVTNTALSSASFGIYAFGVDQVASKTAKFDYFKLVKDNVAPEVTLSVNPSTPSGDNGWWNDAVVATAMATDNQPGQLYIEQKVDDGAWAEYTHAINLTADGTHTVQVRASDTAGNVSEPKSVTVKIDKTAPATTVTGLAAGAELGVSKLATIGATATDALSGLVGVTLTIDGQPLAAGGKIDGMLLGLGAHVVIARATDKAGNVSVTKVPFTVIATYDEAIEVVKRYRDVRTLPLDPTVVMKVQLRAAQREHSKGRLDAARTAMDNYLAEAAQVADVPARTLLVAIGQDLKRRI
jgi:regulation of enolase protein 1 (concanavalin A-like superfamily)